MLVKENNYDMSSYNDTQLIYFIQNGNELAFNELINRYTHIIKSKISGCFVLGMDNEDLFQEGLLGLLNAAKTYNPNKEASFSTYAGLCIKRRLYTLCKSVKRQKRIPIGNLVQLDENSEMCYNNSLNDPEDVFIKKEEEAIRNCYIKKLLSDLEYKVLYMYINGDSYYDISKKINITHKAVDNAIQRIKKKLKSV